MPGPGTYNTKPVIGNDSPLFSIKHRSSVIDCKPFIFTSFYSLDATAKSKNLPGPGSYKHADYVGPQSPYKLHSRVKTPHCPSIPKSKDRFKLPSKKKISHFV